MPARDRGAAGRSTRPGRRSHRPTGSAGVRWCRSNRVLPCDGSPRQRCAGGQVESDRRWYAGCSPAAVATGSQRGSTVTPTSRGDAVLLLRYRSPLTRATTSPTKSDGCRRCEPDRRAAPGHLVRPSLRPVIDGQRSRPAAHSAPLARLALARAGRQPTRAPAVSTASARGAQRCPASAIARSCPSTGPSTSTVGPEPETTAACPCARSRCTSSVVRRNEAAR